MFSAQKKLKAPQLAEQAKAMAATDSEIPLKRIDLTAEVIEIFTIFTLKQTYSNNTDEGFDVEYLFPVLAQSCIMSFEAATDGQVYKGTVELKKKVEERVKELSEAGLPSVTAQHLQDCNDVIKLNIGNLQPGQDMTITIQTSIKLDAITSTAFRLIVPIVLMDRKVKAPSPAPGEREAGPRPANLQSLVTYQLSASYTISFKLIIHKGNLADASLVHMSGYSKDDFKPEADEDRAIYTLREDVTKYPNTDIVILFKREDPNLKTEKVVNSEVPQIITLNKVAVRDEQGGIVQNNRLPVCAFSNFIINPDSKVL